MSKQTTLINQAIKLSFLTIGSILFLFSMQGCNESSNTSSETFTDSRDGQRYSYEVMKDGKNWLTQNLNYKIKDSWCYDDDSNNCKKYGRLYTWEAAIKACPNGWHLPSDDEWWNMTSKYGIVYNGTNGKPITGGADAGKIVYEALMPRGSTGFSAVLGGIRYPYGDFQRFDEYGYYWSSTDYTEDEGKSVWSYVFFHGKRFARTKGTGTKHWGYSCRCIKN